MIGSLPLKGVSIQLSEECGFCRRQAFEIAPARIIILRRVNFHGGIKMD